MKEKLKELFTRVETIAFTLIGLFVLIAFELKKIISDPDIFWHIKTGEYILKTHVIPKVDVFSWWGVGKNLVWVAHEWLADIFLFLGYKYVGWWGLDILTFLTFGLLLFLSVYYLKIRLDKVPDLNEKKRGIALIFGSLMLFLLWMLFLAVRPQLFSFVLIVICAIMFEKNKVWWTIPIIFLGINLHGGFWPIYFAVAAFYLIPRKKFLPLLLIVLFSFLTVNTYYTFLYPFLGLGDTAMRNNIMEWMPAYLFTTGVAMMGSLFILIMILVPKKKIPLWSLLMIVIGTIQGIRSIRFMLFLPLLILPVFFSYIDYERIETITKSITNSSAIKNYERWKIKTFKLDNDKPGGIVALDNSFMLGINISVMTVVVLASVFSVFLNSGTSSEQLLSPDLPINATEYIQQHPETQHNLLNEYGSGGYLIFKDIKTFVDGRSDPFTTSFNPRYGTLDDYFGALYNFSSSPKEFLKKYDIKYILWTRESQLYQYVIDNPTNFKILYKDKKYIVAQVSE